MLREIFRTVPIPYMMRGDPRTPGSFFGVSYHPNIEPYLETLAWFAGMHVGRNPVDPTGTVGDASPDSPTAIYVWTTLSTDWWPSWDFGYYRFDGKSGKFIRRMGGPGGLGAIGAMQYVTTSRMGAVWATNLYGNIIYKVVLGKTAQELVGSETTPEEGWDIVLEGEDVLGVFGPHTGYPIERFGGNLIGYGSFGMDDYEDVYVDVSFTTLKVFRWSTAEFRYAITLPANGVAIALEDSQKCYILLEDRTCILFDYMRNEILGASKIPSLVADKSYWNNLDIVMSYDPVFRRLLVAEKTPNDPTTGACTSVIRGFRMVPEPTRLTLPLPLKAPRQRRIVPFLVQTVGDSNEGVGGYVVKAEVTGAGSLVGIPISDHVGNTLIHVACEGSPYFYDASGDWASTGSPEADPAHTGLVNIAATAYIYQPDPVDIMISGVPGSTPGGTPGAPGGGSTGSLAETAPNMFYIVQQVKDSRPWRLHEDYEDEPDGRGVFIEVCVTAMHDVDARWGHVRKSGSQNQYNGHAVDAICFKNDDGVTAEVFDIVSNDIHWFFVGRSTGALDLWKYPA